MSATIAAGRVDSVEVEGETTGVGGASSLRFGRKAALMSPIPTKNSSTQSSMMLVNEMMNGETKGRNVQGMTLTRFGEPSHTSALSSMMTTILVSQGNNRCKLFLVIPEAARTCIQSSFTFAE